MTDIKFSYTAALSRRGLPGCTGAPDDEVGSALLMGTIRDDLLLGEISPNVRSSWSCQRRWRQR